MSTGGSGIVLLPSSSRYCCNSCSSILFRAAAETLLLVSSRVVSSHLLLSGASRAVTPTDFLHKSSRKRSVIASSMDLPAVIQVHGSHVAKDPPLFFSLLPLHLLTLACINSGTLERPSQHPPSPHLIQCLDSASTSSPVLLVISSLRRCCSYAGSEWETTP